MELSENTKLELKDMGTHERAAIVPHAYMGFISSGKDIEPGLIFTRSDLLTIRKYAKRVKQLPPDKVKLEKEGLDLLGIASTDILHFYQALNDHVGTWDDLENKTKDLSARLTLFAFEFLRNGNEICGTLMKTEGYRKLKLADGERVDIKVEHHALGQDDLIIIEHDVPLFLNTMRSEISIVSSMVSRVKELADHFSRTISNQLSPMVTQLSQRVGDVDVLSKIASYREKIAKLDKSIKEKDEEYSKFVGLAFSGLAFGGVGVIVTGGIYGDQAERVRKQRDKMMAERREHISGIKAITPLLGSLETNAYDFDALKFLLVDVEEAAKNLEDVWRSLDVYVDTSENRLHELKTDVLLGQFIYEFRQVLTPWEKIHGMTTQLSKIFNEPLEG